MQDAPAPYSVLVADAEPTICRVFEAKLTKEGRFRVECASTSQDAYRLGLQHTFDILLWDLRMRDSDTLLPRLRALCPYAALMLMSTDDQPTISVTLSRLDISGILIKPFGLDTLETHIRSALAQRRQQQPLHHLGFVGQYVTLRTPGGECRTRVLENAQDSFLIVGAPRVVTPQDFMVGRTVEVEYNGRGALYAFDSELVREVTGPLQFWEMTMPTVIRRNQRRKAPRIAMHQPIRLEYPSARLCEGTTTDLSILGVALLSKEKSDVGERVQFTLLPDIAGYASITRIQPQIDPDGTLQYHIALRFDELPPETHAYLESLIEKTTRLW